MKWSSLLLALEIVTSAFDHRIDPIVGEPCFQVFIGYTNGRVTQRIGDVTVVHLAFHHQVGERCSGQVGLQRLLHPQVFL